MSLGSSPWFKKTAQKPRHIFEWEANVDDRDPHIRRRALAADLQKLAAGWTPDAAALAAAPLIDNWFLDFYPGSSAICLVGEVSGHPHLRNGIVTTSPIMAIDAQRRWARTHGRFYRIGKRADIKLADMPGALSASVPVASR